MGDRDENVTAALKVGQYDGHEIIKDVLVHRLAWDILADMIKAFFVTPPPVVPTLLFSIASFSDGQSSPQEIGVGVWKAAGALSFTATYTNGPATDAYITHTGWATLPISTPFTGPIVSVSAENYPAVPGNVTFTLNATKGLETSTSTETVLLCNNIFWGISVKANTYLEADVEGLATSAISDTKGRSFTVTAAAGEYIIYALPKRLGTVEFWSGGFLGGFQSPETVSVTNSKSFAEDYYVYRSDNSGLGLTTISVV
jgi:hypothetical protein